jgi:hypothetical protein
MSDGKWIARYPGGGVRISFDEQRDRHEVQISLSELQRNGIDDRIVANLFRAFARCDRLTSLAHLSILNRTLPEGSVASQRNVSTLTTLTFGMMRGMAKVLVALRKAGVERALTDPTPWFRLDEVRRRWLKDASIHWRDRIAFHLCYDTDDAIRGLETLRKRSDCVVLNEIEGNAKLINVRYPIGDEVLFAASELDAEELEQVVAKTPEDSAQMTLDLQAIARDLLRQCGARV